MSGNLVGATGQPDRGSGSPTEADCAKGTVVVMVCEPLEEHAPGFEEKRPHREVGTTRFGMVDSERELPSISRKEQQIELRDRRSAGFETDIAK